MAPDMSRESKRSKRAPCTAASSLPEEIVAEILLLLPSRSILRFRAVCRSWAALLTSSPFTDAYAARADARARRMDKFVVFAPSPNASMTAYCCAQGASVADPLFTVDRMRVDFMCLSSKPCHGTMLFSDTRSGTYWVCNPSTGERVPLPKQHRDLMQSSAGLVYDDRTKERKVVHLFKEWSSADFGCEIYTLCNPTQRYWRPANQDVELIGFNILNFVLGTEDSVTKVPPVFANGCLHWLAYPASMHTPDGQDAILCFSVDTETFTRLDAPSSVHEAAEYKELDEDLPAVPMHLAELERSLCLVHDLRRRGQGRSWLDVWVLRDRATSEWSLDYRIDLTPLVAQDLHSPRFITLLGSYGCAGNEKEEKKKILIATSQHQVHAYDPDKGGIQLVFSAPETDVWIGQKEAGAALWLGLYEDNLVRVEGENRQEKAALSAVTKILARLPVKSIGRSMLVCRQWCSLVESESFVKSHMSLKRPKRILMANNGRARRAFFDFTPVKNWLQASGSTLANDTVVNDKIICSKPCHGLNLISTHTDDFICNPCTGATKCLGRHGKSHFTPAGHHHPHAFSVGRNIGFGFDQSTREHVAVEIGYISATLACMIKTSSEKQWSCIGKPPRMVSDMPPAHVDGTLYWMSEAEPGHERAIVALDISARAFSILPCEPSLKNDGGHTFVVELNGTLSLVAMNAGVGEMDIWMMRKDSSSSSISWVDAYKICLDEHPDYSLKTAGQVVMPVEIDDNDGRILLNTGRALGYYDTKTRALDSLYSLDQLKLPGSSLAFPVLCQESLARILNDELPSRVAPSIRDEGYGRCEHPEHAEATPGQGRLLLLKCEGGTCLDIGAVYRSCCRRLLCESCQSRCLEHCHTHPLRRRDPVLPTYSLDWSWDMEDPDTTLPFCHSSVPGPEYCYYYTDVEGDVVRHVFMSITDCLQRKHWRRLAECGYRREGHAVKETWVRRYLRV